MPEFYGEGWSFKYNIYITHKFYRSMHPLRMIEILSQMRDYYSKKSGYHSVITNINLTIFEIRENLIHESEEKLRVIKLSAPEGTLVYLPSELKQKQRA